MATQGDEPKEMEVEVEAEVDVKDQNEQQQSKKKVDVKDLVYPGTLEERRRYIFLRFVPPGTLIII